MFLENRFEQQIHRIGRIAPVPLRVELWDGRRFDLSSKPTVTIGIPRRSALQYFISPDLNKLGEAFVEGHIRVDGSIHEVFRIAESLARALATSTRSGWRRLIQHSRDSDRKAVQYHYDVSDEFYSLFLDRDMVYSCAYYGNGEETLDAAQSRKLDHILNKLAVKPGERFLDIGCGWGSLVVRAARDYGAIATGITISEKQHEYARRRILAEGLSGRCEVKLCDYRDLAAAGTFDKIASVGMFEHVGLKNLRLYFKTIRSLLKDDGLVLNHGITTSNVDNAPMHLGAGEFIDRYVFPDGELPHLSLVIAEMARAGLEVADVESLRRHYARTCHEWAARLEEYRGQAVRLAGGKRFRIWEIYLAGCAFGFANGWMNLYQVLGCKATGRNPLPLTRDYMYASAAKTPDGLQRDLPQA
jgi:cyclopropane-fatty-acyl-phospholipid synthase